MADDKNKQSPDEDDQELVADRPGEVVDDRTVSEEDLAWAQENVEREVAAGPPEPAERVEQSAAEESTVEPPVTPKPRGRVLAAFATLLALLALGGVGYLYYVSLGVESVAGEDLEALANELAEVGAAQRREAQSISAALNEVTARFEREMVSQRASINASEQALAESISESLKREPPTSREWKLAEAEYLMRIANHRLLMERDVRGARMLLAAADDVLAGLDDFSLFPVRASLAEELASLSAIVPLDVQGAFLRLEAIKTRLDELPLRLPQFVAGRWDTTATPVAASLWQKVVNRLLTLFEFRRYDDEGVRPLLTPGEATYLEMNLRLMLERAQLALLRQDAVLFDVSLDAAREWLALYLEPDNAAVVEVAAELEELSGLDLDRALPDISGSLMALKRVSRPPKDETDSGS